MSARLAVLLAALALATAGCGGDDTSGSCTGRQTGEAVLQGVDIRLQDGNGVRISSINTDDDPPWVRFSLLQATPQEADDAAHVEVGDAFGLDDTTYALVGICSDRAYVEAEQG